MTSQLQTSDHAKPDHNPTPMITHYQGIALVQMPELLIREATLCNELATSIQALCQRSSPPEQIILDFGRTRFLDSSGIGVIVKSLKYVENAQIKLTIWSLANQPLAILTTVGLINRLQLATGTDSVSPTEATRLPAPLPTYHPAVLSKRKRAIDLIVALLGLTTTAVLFVPIALAIKLDSPGSILVKDVYYGWMGKRFHLWRFRTTTLPDSPSPATIEASADLPTDETRRITKVGRLLRRLGLDDYPQFWNVLLGDMSLVGIRPPTIDELKQHQVPDWQRLDVKPGMTGEWLVNGRSRHRPLEELIHLDLTYQAKWSLAYDWTLIAKTLALWLKPQDVL